MFTRGIQGRVGNYDASETSYVYTCIQDDVRKLDADGEGLWDMPPCRNIKVI